MRPSHYYCVAPPPPRWPTTGAALQAEQGRGRIRLTWERAQAATTPATDTAEELYGYQLLRAEGSHPVAELAHYASVRATTPSFLDTEVLSGQTYTYAVQPYDRRGVRGPCSAPLELTLPSPADPSEEHPETAP